MQLGDQRVHLRIACRKINDRTSAGCTRTKSRARHKRAETNSFKGPFTYDVYGLNGNLLDHAAGTITGERITVD
jgi:hypothetical protein